MKNGKQYFVAALMCSAFVTAVTAPQACLAKGLFGFGEEASSASTETHAHHEAANHAGSSHAAGSSKHHHHKNHHHKTKAAEVTVSSEKRGEKNFVTARTFINAPTKVVWDTVHEERKKDPDLAYSKVLEQGENECRLEQKFVLIPVIGTAVCEMHNAEVPLKRIDYKLLKSDRFKAMEGSWVLTPSEDGKGTILELSTHLDLGLPVPGGMMSSATGKKLQRRLGNVKHMAEQQHARFLAQSGQHPQ